MNKPAEIMLWRRLGDVMICVSGSGEVSDETWSRYLDSLEHESVKKYIGVTIGTTQLKSTQRKSGTETLKRRGIRPAVVTDDRLVRGIVTAASWLGLEVKAFSTTELERALEWLEVDAELSSQILKVTKELSAAVTQD